MLRICENRVIEEKKFNQRSSGPVNAHLTPGPGIYFNAFIHVYSPRAGQTTPWEQLLMPIENPYHFAHSLQVLKQSLWSLNLYIFPHVYSSEQGQTTHWGQNFDDNRKAISLCPYVASFKMISSKSDFIHIFNDFIHVYSPGARAYNPLGTNFWCQQKALITVPICCMFKQRNLILYTFLTILYMYIAPGQGQTNPWG